MSKHNSKKDKLDFLRVLKNKNGHVGKACDAFGINRVTFYAWRKANWFAAELLAMQEAEKDDAEEMLRLYRTGVPEYKRNKKTGEFIMGADQKPIVIGWIIKPDPRSIRFYLERKASDRGYGKKQEIDHNLNLDKMPSKVSIGLTVHKKKKK